MKFSRVRLPFKNNKKFKYSIIAILLYLFFLVYTLPASVVFSFITLPKNITLSSVSGSVWSGKVEQVNYSTPDFNLGTLTWQLHPLHLLLGKLNADISLVNGEQFFTSEVSLSLSGAVALEETRFLIDIATLQPLTYGMPFSYAGSISGNFPVSFLRKNHYLQFTGQIDLNDLQLISPQQQSFGDIKVEFRAEKDGGSTAQIKDGDGPLSISGQLTINKDARLNVSTKLSAREPGSALDQIISLMGKKDQTGRVQFNTQLQLF